jgi:hypothetical protein
MTIEVNAAIGGPWEVIGNLIAKAGSEDSSGYRRYLVDLLRFESYETFARQLNITCEEAQELRRELFSERDHA